MPEAFNSYRVWRRAKVLASLGVLVITLGAPAGGRSLAVAEGGLNQTTLASERLPVPETEDLATAERQIRDVFRTEFAAANRAEGKLSLAKSLLQATDKASSAELYAMLTLAARYAAQAGDVTVALEALDKLDAFEGDTYKTKTEALSALNAAVRSVAARKDVGEAALALADQALAEGQYERAEQAVNVAASAAVKSRDTSLRDETRQRRDQLREIRKTWDEYRPAFETLKTTPDDAEANLAAGKFHAYVQRRWKRGLPYLAKGSDATLKALALAELAGAERPAEQIALGDRWWEFARDLLPKEQAAVRWRAGYWYQKAEPQSGGVEKGRLAKRLKEAGRIVDLLGSLTPKQTAQVGHWQFDGKTLTAPPERLARLQFPYEPPEEYEVRIVAQRLKCKIDDPRETGCDGFVLGLSSGSRQFTAIVDWNRHGHGRWAMLGQIDGKYDDDGNPTRHGISPRLPLIREDQPSTIVGTVRKTGVTLTIDDKSVIDWTGDLKRLSLPPPWAVPDRRRLFVGSHLGCLRITSLEVRALDEE